LRRVAKEIQAFVALACGSFTFLIEPMTSSQIRQSFLDFFKSKQHTIVPSSSLMPDSPNLLFTNAGMNQFVPIFLGQTKCPYTPGRAADTQKCIRAGGKHNDLDDVGLDTYHHTFFEMLGNWSFGDYFKKEAIDWAWELVVGIWKFPPSRLYATVYNPDKTKNDPSEFDQEAWSFWAEKFCAAGLDPKIHIVHGNKKDNFWMMGETGPCGPCSELHVDLTAAGDTKGSLVNKGDARCIEIWNLVFIQFNANPDGTFTPLPAQHVDTGMGFERVTSIIQGTKNLTDFANAKISNYETDIFRPIFDVLEKMSGKTYKSTLPVSQNRANQLENNLPQPLPKVSGSLPNLPQPSLKAGEPLPNLPQSSPKASEPLASLRESSPKAPEPLPKAGHSLPETHSVAATDLETIVTDIAFRVIADHIRTLSFAIADGIQPGNTDRNYVLRRILRRAVRYGRTLGFREPFFYKLVDVLADTMGDVFPEICARKKQVQETIRTEEEAFNRTLDKGLDLFESALNTRKYFKSNIGEFSEVIERLEKSLNNLPDSFSSGINRLNEMEVDAEKLFVLVDGFAPNNFILEASSVTAFASFVSAFTGHTATSEKNYLKFIKNYPKLLKVAKKAIADVKLWKAGEFGGWETFVLYDTYGFPLDLTELMARERGLTVDKDGFEKLMEEQRARARTAQKKEVISLSQIETTAPTKFVGFEKLESPARVLEIVSVKDKTAVVLDTSPFYAEMGGQVGDTGELTGSGQLWRVINTQKSGNTFLHFVEGGDAPAVGAGVTLSVEKVRRDAIQRHHTVTHLLHWALHEVASKEASQKGSFVGPDKLTFDFNSAPLTPAQVADIEKLVNERILENAGVSWTEVAHADVKHRKDVMQFFGDKYGDTVRVVQIGGGAGKLDGYSMELCGGTHTRATGEIGLFRIVGESAIAAGVRRIEAVAGLTAYDLANQQLQLIRSIAGKINSPVGELEKKVEALLAHQKELEKSLRTASQREAAGRAKELLAKAETVLGVPAIIANLGDADGDTLQTVADSLKSQFKGVIVLGGASNGAVSLVAAVTSDFTAKVQAGKIIQTIAPIVGGKGGGKPDNARGGGKDASRLDEALAKVKILLG
jgi:alanyl-tRNA synthetase